mgnify:CR=1 FL=1
MTPLYNYFSNLRTIVLLNCKRSDIVDDCMNRIGKDDCGYLTGQSCANFNIGRNFNTTIVFTYI